MSTQGRLALVQAACQELQEGLQFLLVPLVAQTKKAWPGDESRRGTLGPAGGYRPHQIDGIASYCGLSGLPMLIGRALALMLVAIESSRIFEERVSP